MTTDEYMAQLQEDVRRLNEELEKEKRSHDAELHRINQALSGECVFGEVTTEKLVFAIKGIVALSRGYQAMLMQIRVASGIGSGITDVSLADHVEDMAKNLFYLRNPTKLFLDLSTHVDTAVKDFVEKLGKLQSEKESS